MTTARDQLPDSAFAVPSKRDLPIHDKAHVKMAWSAVDKVKGLSDEERSSARRLILSAAHALGVDTKDWHLHKMSFSAMAIQFPEGNVEHSNKTPFQGVLTYLDRPSDKPLFGTGGRRVILPASVARDALGSLMGMAIDFTPEYDGHSPRNKIGIITGADVIDDEIKIQGYFYAKDFPSEVQHIQAEKEKMGFSFEAQSLMQSLKADPLVVSAIEFTGAAVLYKDKAAYTSTSISATADQENDTMTPEQIKALEDATKAIANMPTTIATAVAQAVPLAMKAAADADKAAADAKALADKAKKDEEDRLKLAAGGSAEALAATVTAAVAAAMKPVTDSVSSLATQVKDMSTSIAAGSSKEPQRKTLSPAHSLVLQRLGLSAAGTDGKPVGIKVADLDAAAQKAGLGRQDSMAIKLALKDANLLEAA